MYHWSRTRRILIFTLGQTVIIGQIADLFDPSVFFVHPAWFERLDALVIWRRGHDQIGETTRQHGVDHARVGAVPAHPPLMPPEAARPTRRFRTLSLPGLNLRHVVGIRVVLGAIGEDVFEFEASEPRSRLRSGRSGNISEHSQPIARSVTPVPSNRRSPLNPFVSAALCIFPNCWRSMLVTGFTSTSISVPAPQIRKSGDDSPESNGSYSASHPHRSKNAARPASSRLRYRRPS